MPNLYPYHKNEPVKGEQRFEFSDGTNTKTLFTAPSGAGEKVIWIDQFTISNNNNASLYLRLLLNQGTNDIPFGSVFTNAGAGVTTGLAKTNGLVISSLPEIKFDSLGNRYMELSPGDIIKGYLSAALQNSAGVYLHVMFKGWKF